MLSLGQVRDSVLKRTSQVRVGCRAAVPRPPGGVHRQLLQVGKAPFLRNSCDLTRRQSGKVAQVDRLCAFRSQVVVEKPMVTDLVVGVVGDVLGHIAVEHEESGDVGWSESGSDFQTVEFEINRRIALIGCSAEFGILNPQIGLDLLQSTQERQNCDVSLCDWCVVVVISAEGCRGTVNNAAPIVAVPAATIPFFKNDLRLLAPPNTLPFFSIAIFLSRIELRTI